MTYKNNNTQTANSKKSPMFSVFAKKLDLIERGKISILHIDSLII